MSCSCDDCPNAATGTCRTGARLLAELSALEALTDDGAAPDAAFQPRTGQFPDAPSHAHRVEA